MKKMMLWLVSGAALALVSCENQLDSTTDNTDRFVVSTVYASAPGGRTANDGFATNWSADDVVNLFAVESGLFESATAGQIHNHGQFKTDGTGLFTFTGGSVSSLPELDPTKSYDWFMLFAYKAARNKPFGLVDQGFVTVGSDVENNLPSTGKSGIKTQTGVNSTAHLVGSEGFPLQGMTTTAPGDNAPRITMHQIVSVAEVVVTNESGKKTLVKIELKSTNHTLVGRFVPDWSKEKGFNLKTHGVATRASTTAALNLKNVTLAKGDVGSFYLGIKPHEMVEADELKVIVTFGDGSTVEKVFTGVNTTFSAGKIKKVYMTI